MWGSRNSPASAGDSGETWSFQYRSRRSWREESENLPPAFLAWTIHTTKNLAGCSFEITKSDTTGDTVRYAGTRIHQNECPMDIKGIIAFHSHSILIILCIYTYYCVIIIIILFSQKICTSIRLLISEGNTT